MARDLASDVEKLLRSNNSYLRKKAVLATIRLLKKEPDLIDHMSERTTALLKDRAHGVLITGLQLIIEVLDLQPDLKDEYVKLVPSLVRLLRNFISMGFSPEHDVGGITDPFMQVKLLNLLRRLGKGNDEASEQMNDVLAQVATNTETLKNAGNAILYECVQTIMEVQSDASLRVLAVNILGRFLLNRDNNIRYVALNSLSKVVNEDMAAVQRHRHTIVECLKDADISIRQRAMELVFQLVDTRNAAALTAELLNYLVVAHSDHRIRLISQIIRIAERHAPTPRWRVDTIITMLSLSGTILDETVTRAAILHLSQTLGYQAYATHRLFRTACEDNSPITLLHVALWCIGEHADLLIRPCAPPGDDPEATFYPAVPEQEIVSLFEKCLKLHYIDVTTKALILNALVKATARLSPALTSCIMDIINPYKTSLSVELQQRSVEYISLLNGKWDSLRGKILGNIPHVSESVIRRRQAAFDTDEFQDNNNNSNQSNGKNNDNMITSNIENKNLLSKNGNLPTATVSPQTSLLDLDDIFGLGPSTTSTPITSTPITKAPNQSSNSVNIDLLSDIFSTSNISNPATPIIPANTNFMFPTSSGLAISTSTGLNNSLMYGVSPISPVSPIQPMANSMNVNGGTSNGLMGMGNTMNNTPLSPNPMPTLSPMTTSYNQSTMSLPSTTLPQIIAFEKDGLKVIIYVCIYV
jgi:AP-1 complex subunit gamma-1